jgi:hypothetical protein
MIDEAREGKLRDDLSRGHEAQTILDHPVVVQAFARVRERIQREFESCGPNDQDRLLRIKLTYDILKCVETEIREIRRKGEDAKRELGLMDRMRERLKTKGWIDH